MLPRGHSRRRDTSHGQVPSATSHAGRNTRSLCDGDGRDESTTAHTVIRAPAVRKEGGHKSINTNGQLRHARWREDMRKACAVQMTAAVGQIRQCLPWITRLTRLTSRDLSAGGTSEARHEAQRYGHLCPPRAFIISQQV